MRTDHDLAPTGTSAQSLVLTCVGMLLAAALALLVGCGRDADTRQEGGTRNATAEAALARTGQEIFRNRDFGSTGVACADCHSDGDERIAHPTRIFAGHSIVGAARRVATWNGAVSGEALAATAAGSATCAQRYLERVLPDGRSLRQDEADALMAFFEAISTGDEAARIQWTAVTWPGDPDTARAKVDAAVARIMTKRGNAERGATLFSKACGICHGTGGLGVGPSYRMLKRKLDELPRVVRSGSENMPFFATDRLSDQEIADIRAWLESAR